MAKQESRSNYMPYFSSLSGVVAFCVLFPLLTLQLSLHSVFFLEFSVSYFALTPLSTAVQVFVSLSCSSFLNVIKLYSWYRPCQPSQDT